MKVLFISVDLIGGNLAYLLKNEGHDVKIYIRDKARRNNFSGLLKMTSDWRSELNWVGKKGLIVFDDVGFGEEQDKLRRQGYTVFGGSKFGDKLEQDRSYGNNFFKEIGMKTVSLHDFDSPKDALNYVKQNKKKIWVIKQNSHHYSKVLTYIGQRKDALDVIDTLTRYSENPFFSNEKITLQEKIEGIEIGVGRYFNGKDWVGPIEFNIEHPNFFPKDLGPVTSEMGTLAWYTNNEKIFLYQKTISLAKSFLASIDFRGDFEINFIVNKEGIYPLEATTRIGSPIVHLQSALQNLKWADFLYSVAAGKHFDLKYKRGFGIVTLLAMPPFPYATEDTAKGASFGARIFFDKIKSKDMSNVHFEEVSYDKNRDCFYVSDTRGYVMYVTSVAKTISQAQRESLRLISKIKFPKMFYRDDIGEKFKNKSFAKLIEWNSSKKPPLTKQYHL